MTSRTDAAYLISDAIEADGYTTSVWAPQGDAGPVRVYVTIPAASRKKVARKIGYVSIELDGSITSGLEKQSGAIMSLLPDLTIDAARSEPAPATEDVAADEDVAAFRRSERAVAAAELSRERD